MTPARRMSEVRPQSGMFHIPPLAAAHEGRDVAATKHPHFRLVPAMCLGACPLELIQWLCLGKPISR